MDTVNEKFLVTTKQGKLLGTEYVSDYNNARYFAFLGIPYAKPPLGGLRFMPPEPPSPWNGIRSAKRPGKDCLHKLVWAKTNTGSEDCLYLNVYTPEAPCEIKTPKSVCVMVHSGGNAWGSAAPDYYGTPDFLVHHDVIMVAMNYRLHVFGFLNLDLPQCSGNMGMKDIIMALCWVKENIECFGGDPNNITLCGNSSAATNIHLIMISPLAKGLFNKAILQGGYALSPLWSYQENHRERADELAQVLGFKGNHTKRLLRYLKQLPAEDIVEALNKLRKKLKEKTRGRLYNSIFMVSIEAFEEGAFLTRSPREMIHNNDPIPLVWDVCDGEGLHALAVNSWDFTLPEILRENLWMYKISPKTLQILEKEVAEFYFSNKDISRITVPELVDLFSDIWYIEWYDVLNFQATRPNAQPLFLYLFKFRGALNFVNFLVACHADECVYFIYHKVFLRITNTENVITSREQKVIDNMATFMTNFMKTGNVNTPIQNKTTIDWKPYHSDDPHYLEFDGEVEMKKGIINEERTRFWQRMMKMIKENENLPTENDIDIENLKLHQQ
ncbi:hypothetical protein V9T40_007838 [Parthenolecanium corni]|uniref:Carboxylesterase type B domain-containing protein n=1 Tax=Parthenolecanium corni TaxID=536013 RepID=A0AAN9TMF4_9HEMI